MFTCSFFACTFNICSFICLSLFCLSISFHTFPTFTNFSIQKNLINSQICQLSAKLQYLDRDLTEKYATADKEYLDMLYQLKVNSRGSFLHLAQRNSIVGQCWFVSQPEWTLENIQTPVHLKLTRLNRSKMTIEIWELNLEVKFLSQLTVVSFMLYVILLRKEPLFLHCGKLWKF